MASIRCAQGHTHDSVAAVRSCAGVSRPLAGDYAHEHGGSGQRYGAVATVDSPVGTWATVKELRAQVVEAVHALDEGMSKLRVATMLAGEDKLRFFKLRLPTRGRWVGYVFVEEQAGPQTYDVKSPERVAKVLQAVLRDGLLSALARYGKELGYCGKCSLELTDETSRARGIGPVCWGKLGL